MTPPAENAMTSSSTRNKSTEFSRPERVDRLPSEAVVKSIRATNDECRAVAGRLGLEALHGLSAELTIKLGVTTGVIRITGRFDAQVRQICVVTLEPFDADVGESIDLSIAAVPADIEADIIDIDPLAEDDLEPLEGNILDIGEIVTQHLSLALDPHPRKPGAESPALSADQDQNHDVEDEQPNPFAALAKLKNGKT